MAFGGQGGGQGYGNYVRQRVRDAGMNRGDRLRQVLSGAQFASNGGGGADRRNRGQSNATAYGGSANFGNVDPSAKLTVSTRGGTANANGQNVTMGNVNRGDNININANGGYATSGGGQGGGQRKPVSFATYADQNNPLRAPAPAFNIPGFQAANQQHFANINQAFERRNADHRAAVDAHNQQMRQYNDAIRQGQRDAAPPVTTPTTPPVTTQPITPAPGTNASGGTRGDHRNTGPGGGRDRARNQGTMITEPIPAPINTLPTPPPPNAPGRAHPGRHGGRGQPNVGLGDVQNYPSVTGDPASYGAMTNFETLGPSGDYATWLAQNHPDWYQAVVNQQQPPRRHSRR